MNDPPASHLSASATASGVGCIAWLASGTEGYGILRCMTTLAGELARRGWRTPLICLSDGPAASAAKAEGLEVHVLGLGPAPRFAGGMLRKLPELLEARRYTAEALPAVRRVLEQVGADALHVVSPQLVTLAGKAARTRAIPCLWEMPNLIGDRYPLGLNRRLYQWVCRRYGIIVLADSEFTRQTLVGGGVDPIVFYHATDHTRFDPERVSALSRQEIGLPREAIVLGIFARMTALKGQDRVVAALGRFREHAPPIHLLLLGGPLDDEYGQRVASLARERGIADRVHLKGPVADPEQYFQAIDVGINSRVDPEPFGLSVIEAMMMERPVLVHASGGPAETVVDGVTGWHAPGLDEPELAATLERALADRPRWHEMGREARRWAIERFSARTLADRYELILKQAGTPKRRT